MVTRGSQRGKCQKLQFLKWPLEADSKNKSIPIDPHVKMANFTAEMNIFTAWSFIQPASAASLCPFLD